MPKVIFSALNNVFYLSGNSNTYILDGDKLGKSRYEIYSTSNLRNRTKAYVSSTKENKVYVEVFPQDMNRRALKLVKNVDYDGEGFSDPEISLKYRYGVDDSWRESDWRTISPEGVSWHMITCTDFIVRFRATATNLAEGHLNSLVVRYTPVDMRGLKGLTEQGADYA